MLNLTIDGIPVQVPEGTTLLEAARQCGIWIPTLCHHESLTPYGGCRLCVVEVRERKVTHIVASCTAGARNGLEVVTCSDTLLSIRKGIVSLLLAEVPQSPVLQELGAAFGVTGDTRYTPRNDSCIACGRCIRACREIVGVSAIDFAYRGYKKVPAPPFFERSESCIGCGTCVAVCPTGAITMHDIQAGIYSRAPDGSIIEGPARIIDNWKVSFPLKTCSRCGEPFVPQAVLDHCAIYAKLPADFFELCRECRQ
ncbi:MAG: 2Fe-2S iron-sulfur cluster-binding protein [Desulfobacterota bacterium]|nr:2Fe-2S iron-sulfur cluster-binding protein [Thermodesulfobacteriota bacterium]